MGCVKQTLNGLILWNACTPSVIQYMGAVLRRAPRIDHLGHPDDIWALSWTHTNHLLSGCADGRVRVFEPTAAQSIDAIQDIVAHPLAVTSLSVSKDGRKALSSSLDGSVCLIHPTEGRILGKLDTGKERESLV